MDYRGPTKALNDIEEKKLSYREAEAKYGIPKAHFVITRLEKWKWVLKLDQCQFLQQSRSKSRLTMPLK